MLTEREGEEGEREREREMQRQADLNEGGQNADAVVRLDSVVEARKLAGIPVNQVQLYKTQHMQWM